MPTPHDTPTVFRQLADALETDWTLHARPNQLPPPGVWAIWLALAGRGWGKTRAGAEWVRGEVESGRARRVALVGATASDLRDVMIEGESGLLAVASPWCRPTYEVSKRRLSWPNGAIATAYSAEEPDRLRGPQHDLLWADELASWQYMQETWDMAMFGLRLGRNPRCMVTTTPRPLKLIRDLLAREGQDVVVSRGATRENAENLAPTFLNEIVRRYQGTRLGRQELDAELLNDVPGALWQREWIDEARVTAAPEDLVRVVVAVDPATTSGENADETGIVVCAVDADGHGYVLADVSGRYQPHEWAAKAISAYHRYKADFIVAEVNQGGDMVEAVIRQVDPNVAFRKVHASRGKVARAEPVSAIYEQRRISHVGSFPQLEDQLCSMTNDFDRSRAGYSPDRVDALVWGMSQLIIEPMPGAGLLEFYEREAKAAGVVGMVYGDELPVAPEQLPTVQMRVPPNWFSSLHGTSGRQYAPIAGGLLDVLLDDAGPLRRLGFTDVTKTEEGVPI